MIRSNQDVPNRGTRGGDTTYEERNEDVMGPHGDSDDSIVKTTITEQTDRGG